MSVSGYLQVYENHGQDSRYKSIETCPTISAKAGTGGNNLPIVVHETTGALMNGGRTAGSATTQDALSGMLVVHGDIPDLADTLLSGGNGKAGRQDPLNGVMIPVYGDGIPDLANTLTARMAKGINTTLDEGQTPIVVFSQNQSGSLSTDDVFRTLTTSASASARNTPLVCFAQNSRDELRMVGGDGQISGALAAQPGMKQQSFVLSESLGVRRLMPVECERLMGFEADYTLVPWRKGMAPDGPRYRAIGNSKARPICEWIARRIQAFLTTSTEAKP
jgi:DNA (cytosine-5)-methyltransferase 1